MRARGLEFYAARNSKFQRLAEVPKGTSSEQNGGGVLISTLRSLRPSATPRLYCFYSTLTAETQRAAENAEKIPKVSHYQNGRFLDTPERRLLNWPVFFCNKF